MPTKVHVLPVEPRETTGSSSASALRAKGMVPAVLYGHGDAPRHLAMEGRAFEELAGRHEAGGVLTLVHAGKTIDTALLRAVQRHPVTRRVIHVDFQRVGLNEAVTARVPIATVGVAPGVKEFGGVMDLLSHHIEVEGPADQLPEHIDIDVSELGVHRHISAGEVKLPKGFRLVTSPETVLITVEASKTARQVEESAVGTTAEQIEPEVLGQKSETKA